MAGDAAHIVFGRVNSIEFDLARRQIHFKQYLIWKRSEQVIPFARVENVGVVSSSSTDGGWTQKVVLVLDDGEQIQLTAHPASGLLAKKRLAKRIAATLNQFRTEKIKPALDGRILSTISGETSGIQWQMEFASANGRIPVTRWKSSQIKFRPGFILLIPVREAGDQTAGQLSKTSLFFFRQYLGSLMIDASSLPGFADASVLSSSRLHPGGSFTCLTNDPSGAEAWLCGELLAIIEDWANHPLLKGSRSESLPHLLGDQDGLQLIYCKTRNQEDEIRRISDFGVSLVQCQID